MARDCGLGDIDVGTYPSEGATHTFIQKGISGALIAGILGTAAGGLGIAGILGAFAPAHKVEVNAIDLEVEVINDGTGPAIIGVKRINGNQ